MMNRVSVMCKDVKAFLKTKRQTSRYRPVCERIKDYKQVCVMRKDKQSQEQASRCMNCGTPFCHWGCPVGNYIPEWNDLMFQGHWEKAVNLLHAGNNFPEITGRICPALCESACVLGVNDEPVTVRENELAIIEYGFKKGLIKPNPPKRRTGKRVAVIGSGPAGLAVAAQLNKAGHIVVVFEKDDKIGGILRYGIPEYKLEKNIIDRRINLLKKEGIKFKTNVNVGIDYPVKELLKDFNAVCLAGGSRVPRDLKIEGRNLNGIYFAMDYLTQANKIALGKKISQKYYIDTKGKNVVVIGGGDTGANCVGTANRQGANCVVQIEVMPKPSETRTEDFPWPNHPLLLKTTSEHEEGVYRQWCVLTKRFIGKDGVLKKLSCVEVEFLNNGKNNRPIMKEIKNSEFEIDADLVLLAIGFLHPEHKGLLTDLKLEFDQRGNVKANADYMTSKKGIFTAGDMHSGQSLVIRAISEGRNCAANIDKYLMGNTDLPILK